jgi:hypothetical protein
MLPQRTPILTPERHGALDAMYYATRVARVCTRAQMDLLAAKIAAIVRESEETVRRWLRPHRDAGARPRQSAFR